jgi:WhiB family transcriptional regulator, redox-sensing transcriptional regulator
MGAREIPPPVDLFFAEPQDWTRLAACRGLDPAIFFPDQGESAAKAKAICARCPVQIECSEYADRTRTDHGVWGGRTRGRGR